MWNLKCEMWNRGLRTGENNCQVLRWRGRTRRSQRGMALVSTLMVLLVILAVMLIGTIGSLSAGHTGVMNVTTNSLAASGTRTQAVAAFNMAQSGVNLTMYWLGTQAGPPAYTAAFAPALPGYATTGSPARSKIIPNLAKPTDYFTVEIYPDSSNTTNTQKKYLIESVGTSNGFNQIVRAYVEQTSLSKYEVLLDQWYPSNNYWVQGLSSFDGPVHDNNTGGQQENTLWLSSPGSTSPLFTYTGDDAYTVSSSGVNWYKNNFSSSGAPTTQSDWASVAVGGASTVHTASSVVTFPTASTLQMNAALGATAAPSSTGVLVPTSAGAATAGIYIHGNVNTMALSVGNPDTTQQIITITQTGASSSTIVTTVTLKPSTNQTHVTTVTTPTSGGATTTNVDYTGTTNGVVYCDGNIGTNVTSGSCAGGLYGVVADNVVDGSGNITHRNALTIATDSSKSMNLDGNVTYHTARAKSGGAYVSESQDANFTQKAGVLGVISNNIMLDQKDYTGANITNGFEFDGTEFAYNTCDADNYGGRSIGTWENMGSYISKIVGVFGTFNSANSLTNGFNTQFNYDMRLRDSPPPYFPTTGNQYDTVSWQRVSSTLQ